MAATRKLQGEIDRCLKKVTEGVDTFEDIWKKVHNATNSNQKEKYEADLKKEIKKLQRLRDQIKSWIASAEIKDKSALLENRRLIETQMERFKVVERETKTKAYSKEGLGAVQKLDPAQRVKDVNRNWLTSSISTLQIQIDQYESEVESLLAGKKKRLDRDKQDRMDELRSKLDRHKFHVTKLETLLRLLDNDNVEAEQVNNIKDDVEYYIYSSQEPDFEENEFIYDDIIGLDEVELSGTGVSLGIPSSATTDSNNSNETSGSPSSITSGGSPAQSPLPAQQQQQTKQHNQSLTATTTIVTGGGSMQQQQPQNNINYSNDLTGIDAAAIDKRNKNDSNAINKTKQPVKPTAVRATNKTQPLHHSQQQQQQHIAPHGGTSTMHNPASAQHHTPAPSLQTPTAASIVAAGMATVSTTAATTTNIVNGTNVQGQSVIQATPTIAFSAVAKHNTTHHENGPIHSVATYAVVGGSNQVQQQQQQQHMSNLQMNSSHLQNAHNSTSNIITVNSMANVIQQQQQSSNSIVKNISANATNCISPSNMSSLQQQQQQIHNTQQQQQQVITVNAINATRISPGLISPKQMNGGIPLNNTINSNNNSIEAISLKTMAQEAINRSIIDTNNLVQATTTATTHVENRQQSQQQQQVLQQHFTNDTTANSHHQQQQQQQQQNSTVSLATVVAVATATAATNGPTTANMLANTTVGGSNSLAVGQMGNLLGTTALTSPNTNSQQQPIGSTVSGLNSSNINTKQQQQQQQQQQSQHQKQQQQHTTNEAHIPPLLGVAPLGPLPLDEDTQLQFQLMEAAFTHLPTPSDSEKLSVYFHRTPVPTPPYYPQAQLPNYDTVEFYQRLSTETLFFVFYYMEGSKAQYLAAKALKKQSWRFHTKYMMWFQRHEEPKIINDDYEQGTYIYFDYEKWSQRKKEGFTFEYKYLEDKDLN